MPFLTRKAKKKLKTLISATQPTTSHQSNDQSKTGVDLNSDTRNEDELTNVKLVTFLQYQ